MCMYVCMRACVRAFVRACVRACMRVFFRTTRPGMDSPRDSASSPLPSLLEPPVSPGELDYGVVLDMVQQINSKLELLNLDTLQFRPDSWNV